ncbi:MAG: S41 family peptidase, partial [Saprospiraceae bacterium]|nr:S41 family peptidase [Saprospiraceae bacterium]
MPETDQRDSSKLNIWLPLLFSLVMVIGMVLGARLAKTMDFNDSPKRELIMHKGQPSTLEEVMRFIDARYVDDINAEEISEDLIAELLKELDPHSNYLTPESVSRINEDLEGNFNGIGIEFIIMEDTIHVIKTIANGPSEKAGILSGDRIIQVGDSLVAGAGIPQDQLVNLIRGSKGSKVKLDVKRRGHAELIPITVTRDAIPIYSLDAAFEISKGVLFAKLNRFSATTYKEFMQGVEKYIDPDQKYQLILDLRDNPGGFLDEAVDILCQIFEERDRLLVYTEGGNTKRIEYKTTGRNFYSFESVAILVDEGSASASEIIAGAIQDWDRGYIIGRRTFGKGLVQEQYPLKNGGALRLTTARYYTPAGRSIQRDYSNGEKAYYDDMEHRFENGGQYSQDSLAWQDSTEYQTNGGRIVYGGGGID